jgi:hypothetical protein
MMDSEVRLPPLFEMSIAEHLACPTEFRQRVTPVVEFSHRFRGDQPHRPVAKYLGSFLGREQKPRLQQGKRPLIRVDSFTIPNALAHLWCRQVFGECNEV